ncbi:hypothetical protein AC249_AIPGENE6621, partial [Exaiptasia diaphana]
TERKSEHGHEFKENIQVLIERFEVKQKASLHLEVTPIWKIKTV